MDFTVLQQCISQSEMIPDPQVIGHLEKALQYRAEKRSPEAVRNTYLKDLEIPQIVLFDILANRFPLVIKAQQIVTAAMLKAVKGRQNIVLLDLGIGRGLQVGRILEAFNKQEHPPKLIIIGVEIVPEALAHTGKILAEKKKELKFDFSFHPLLQTVESLDVSQIKSLIPDEADAFLVNASLTLHHIQSTANRHALMQKLKSLNPVLLTLIEPDTDCHTDDFNRRLFNVYEHFNGLYLFINSLELTDAEKSGLKQFFSTELFDAVALPDEHRFERYEPGAHWLKHASLAGFRANEDALKMIATQIPNINIGFPDNSYCSFSYQQAHLLSTIILK